ncbi:enediyne biosynthesis protein E7 [Rhizobiaceae bacterium]|nr:enediyne biosynthesis protein E7 [Rhizobiaceae bacterium]
MADHAKYAGRRPRPPAPTPRARIPGPIAFFRVLRRSAIEGLALDHYEKPIVFTRTVLGPVLVVCSPTALRHVLVTNAANYPRETLQRRMISDGLGFGLLAAEGEQWRNQRKVLAPHFTPERIAGLEKVTAKVVGRFVERWDSLGDDATVRLNDEVCDLAIDVLEAALFPDGLSGKAAIMPALKSYFRKAGRLSALDAFALPERIPRIPAFLARRSVATLRRLGEGTVDAWRKHAGRTARAGILDGMAAEGRAKPFTPIETRDIVTTFMAAGTETSAGAMCWAFYLLSLDPEWRTRLEDEVDREMPDGIYVEGSLMRLPVTRAVVEETLRLYPTVAVTARKAIAADTIDGRAVTPGTIIVISPWLIHRHRKLWAEPDLFDPGRFMPGAREKIDRFAFLPFGAGPRICVGQGFAMQEMIIAVASIARRFLIEPAPGFDIWPELTVTLQPSGDLPVVLRRRARMAPGDGSN